MTLELSATERRLILQGIWKEADMYAKMKNEAEDRKAYNVIEHSEHMIKTLDKLENKLLGW